MFDKRLRGYRAMGYRVTSVLFEKCEAVSDDYTIEYDPEALSSQDADGG